MKKILDFLYWVFIVPFESVYVAWHTEKEIGDDGFDKKDHNKF